MNKFIKDPKAKLNEPTQNINNLVLVDEDLSKNDSNDNFKFENSGDEDYDHNSNYSSERDSKVFKNRLGKKNAMGFQISNAGGEQPQKIVDVLDVVDESKDTKFETQ